MKNYKEKSDGITMIALVVTVIVLLILAGISLSALNGNNSLIEKAGSAKEKSIIAEEKEVLSQGVIQAMGKNKFGNLEKEQLQNSIDNIIGENVCEIFETEENFRAIFLESERCYIIDNDGEISEMVITGETNGIYIDDTNISTLELDGAMLLSPTQHTIPSVKDNLNYIWTSSNPSIVTVTADGIIKCGTELGTATITCEGANSKSTCQVTTTARIVYSNNQNTDVTINNEEGNYGNPTIPKDYSAITTKDAVWNLTGSQTSIDSGLVIMDNRGNQFVWVPVPNVVYDETTEIESGIYTPMAVLKTNSTTDYKGILYTFEGSTASRHQSSNNVEPSTVKYDFTTDDEEQGFALLRRYISGMDNKTDEEIRTAWTNQLQKEYNDLINSISKYGGFWIGRYEISYDNNKNRLASIAGVKSASASEENTKTWYGIYQKIKDFSKNTSFNSTMIYGSQFNAMLNWMSKDGIPVGNSRNNCKWNI